MASENRQAAIPSSRDAMHLVQSFSKAGCSWSIHYFVHFGVRVYCLSGQRPKRGKNVTGPQDAMQKYATENHLTMYVAFDHERFRKVFGAIDKPASLYYNIIQNVSTPTPAYEVVREKHPCRLYVDLEWPHTVYSASESVTVLRAFIRLLMKYIRELFPLYANNVQESNLRLATATRKNKTSYHLVLDALHPLSNKPLFFSDPETHLRAFMEYFYRWCVEKVIYNKDPDATLMFWRDVENKQIKCVWDTRVYTPNRQFRFVGCSKTNTPDSVLLPCDLDGNQTIRSFKDIAYEHWIKYLVCKQYGEEIALISDTDEISRALLPVAPSSIKSKVYMAINMHLSLDEGHNTAVDLLDRHKQEAQCARKRTTNDIAPLEYSSTTSSSTTSSSTKSSSTSSLPADSSSSSSAFQLNSEVFSLFSKWNQRTQAHGKR